MEARYAQSEGETGGENLAQGVIDRRPSSYTYALLANHAYGGNSIKRGEQPLEDKGWEVWDTRSGASGYFGAIYVNNVTQQVVVAHRGTDSLKALIEDVNGVFLNRQTGQKSAAFELVKEAVEFAKMRQYTLSFTGHSLGGFLAEVSVYYCQWSHAYSGSSAVTFESPGCRESLESIQSNHAQTRINLDDLDIESYLSYPNLVNTCNHHVGTLYGLSPKLKKRKWIADWHLLKVHSMDNIVQTLGNREAYVPYILDWPMGNQRKVFFEYAIFDQEELQFILPEEARWGEDQYELDYEAHFKVSDSQNHHNVLPLIHFKADLRNWLKEFYKNLWRYEQIAGKEAAGEALGECMKTFQVPGEIALCLLGSRLIRHQEGSRGTLLFQLLADEADVEMSAVRNALSEWWVENQEVAGKLQRFVFKLGEEGGKQDVRKEERPDLDLTVFAKGVKIQPGADFTGTEISQITTDFPEDTDERNIEYLKALAEHQLVVLKEKGIKLRATVFAEGAEINTPVRGLDFSMLRQRVRERQLPRVEVTARPSHLDTQGLFAASMPELTPAPRTGQSQKGHEDESKKRRNEDKSKKKGLEQGRP